MNLINLPRWTFHIEGASTVDENVDSVSRNDKTLIEYETNISTGVACP